ncbi:hypothetical protein ACFY2W_10580 [Streptomyces sp. NPDC001262]|uniref:hypothetical protein n=1 Tax=Streptomyces sp. NPDC001262 TaxID=3364552 RepID=UPI0036C7D43A
MRTYIGGQQAVSDIECAELALGTLLELWLGVEGESAEERAARLDAARDILADDPQMPDRTARAALDVIETNAPSLFNVRPLARPGMAKSRMAGKAVA